MNNEETNEPIASTPPQDSEAFKKQFQFGHMEEQLICSGEPEATVDAIENGTYDSSMPNKSYPYKDNEGNLITIS